MTPTDPRLGDLAHRVRALDPGSRALLDLSVRRGLGDVEIAGVLGTDPNYVQTTRTDVIQSIAADLRLEQDELAQLEAALSELPTDTWLPPLEADAAPNGAANGAGHAVEAGALADPGEAVAPEPAPEPFAEPEASAPVEPEASATVDEESVEEPSEPDVSAPTAGTEEVAVEEELPDPTAGTEEVAVEEPADPEASGDGATVDEPAEEEIVSDAEVAEPVDEDVSAETSEADEVATDSTAEEVADEEDAAEPERPDVAAGDRGDRPETSVLMPGSGRKRRQLGAIVTSLALVLVGAVLVIALATNGDDDTGGSDEPAAPAERDGAPGGGARDEERPSGREPRGSGGDESRGREAEIAGLAGTEGIAGTARLDGRRLELSISGLPEGQGNYQVWLYDSLIDAVSIGRLRPSDDGKLEGEFEAEGLSRYEFVDISLEPADGNANHSGRSVARLPTSELR